MSTLMEDKMSDDSKQFVDGIWDRVFPDGDEVRVKDASKEPIRALLQTKENLLVRRNKTPAGIENWQEQPWMIPAVKL
eukprot:3464806-Rhodomonas_salina.1